MTNVMISIIRIKNSNGKREATLEVDGIVSVKISWKKSDAIINDNSMKCWKEERGKFGIQEFWS